MTPPASIPASNPGFSSEPRSSQSACEPQVYCIHGADPEVQAYAMAKYSRSALSMKQSLAELNEQKAEKFLNTFYFQYGHRSIADLAHVAMAIERLSILAATIVVDESRWDGQERSTRYQDFQKSGHYTPELGDASSQKLYDETIQFLFSEYREFSELNYQFLLSKTPRPAEMKEDAYERTLRARAFDISRYLLPLATNTSLGQIVNARTLETQVSRLLSNSSAEVRRLGELMKQAAREAAWDVNSAQRSALADRLAAALSGKDAALAEQARAELLRPVHVSPTLLKYTEPCTYQLASAKELAQAEAELMRGQTIMHVPAVDLLDNDEPLEIQLATTLLYQHSRYPYRQLREAVVALGFRQRNEIISIGTRHRGPHDELLRAFSAGQSFRFDILMDVGAYRDLHRHRRCIQIHQDYCFDHDFDTPVEIAEAGYTERYAMAMQRAAAAGAELSQSLTASGESPQPAQYLIPLAYRTRTLFQMDFAEVVYISELRTKPAGHWSYRKVAYEMYEQVARRHPALAGCFRVTDVTQPVDLLQR